MSEIAYKPYFSYTDREIALLMIQWAEKQAEADAMRRRIEQHVVQRGSTIDVADIRCSYTKGRDKYQSWEDAVEGMSSSPELLELIGTHTTTEEVVKTDWKAVCEELDIEREIVEHGTPSAKLMVLKK